MRPPKAPEDRTDQHVTVCLTGEEYEWVKEAAWKSKLPLSTYIRHLILKVKTTSGEK